MTLRASGKRSVGAGDGAWSRRAGGLAQLTQRERQVLAEITGGASNKEAGRRLGISPRTIEVHRASIMDKLGAKNAADLVRITLSEGRR
jgi:DNA-binding CsgD family transcriptional regulator